MRYVLTLELSEFYIWILETIDDCQTETGRWTSEGEKIPL